MNKLASGNAQSYLEQSPVGLRFMLKFFLDNFLSECGYGLKMFHLFTLSYTILTHVKYKICKSTYGYVPESYYLTF